MIDRASISTNQKQFVGVEISISSIMKTIADFYRYAMESDFRVDNAAVYTSS